MIKLVGSKLRFVRDQLLQTTITYKQEPGRRGGRGKESGRKRGCKAAGGAVRRNYVLNARQMKNKKNKNSVNTVEPLKVPEFASLNCCELDLYLTVTSIKRTRSPFRSPIC